MGLLKALRRDLRYMEQVAYTEVYKSYTMDCDKVSVVIH